jgi:hypothetical protein
LVPGPAFQYSSTHAINDPPIEFACLAGVSSLASAIFQSECVAWSSPNPYPGSASVELQKAGDGIMPHESENASTPNSKIATGSGENARMLSNAPKKLLPRYLEAIMGLHGPAESKRASARRAMALARVHVQPPQRQMRNRRGHLLQEALAHVCKSGRDRMVGVGRTSGCERIVQPCKEVLPLAICAAAVERLAYRRLPHTTDQTRGKRVRH